MIDEAAILLNPKSIKEYAYSPLLTKNMPDGNIHYVNKQQTSISYKTAQLLKMYTGESHEKIVHLLGRLGT